MNEKDQVCYFTALLNSLHQTIGKNRKHNEIHSMKQWFFTYQQ
jgi:hypothetical protein